MVAPFRVPHHCARTLSIVRAYAHDANETVNPCPPLTKILTFEVSGTQFKRLTMSPALRGRRQYDRLNVEYEMFVSVGCFHIHSSKRRVMLSSFRRFPMAFQIAPFFPHRRNKDGSFNSICLKCFATVASHMTEEELKEQDKNHVCVKSVLSERGNHVSLVHNENETREPR
jgi:hypothetical protein